MYVLYIFSPSLKRHILIGSDRAGAVYSCCTLIVCTVLPTKRSSDIQLDLTWRVIHKVIFALVNKISTDHIISPPRPLSLSLERSSDCATVGTGAPSDPGIRVK